MDRNQQTVLFACVFLYLCFNNIAMELQRQFLISCACLLQQLHGKLLFYSKEDVAEYDVGDYHFIGVIPDLTVPGSISISMMKIYRKTISRPSSAWAEIRSDYFWTSCGFLWRDKTQHSGAVFLQRRFGHRTVSTSSWWNTRHDCACLQRWKNYGNRMCWGCRRRFGWS